MFKQTFVANVVGPWTITNGLLEAPVVMMVEGVHSGSYGPIYWPAHVLRAAAPKWAGAPVVIDHPQVDGQAVSINYSPAIRASTIGTVASPCFDEAKKALKATVQVPANNPRIGEIQGIREVSAGIFGENTSTYGTWNGESYDACAITMEPDHLALLPDTKGACSWEDGCGIRTNQAVKGEGMTEVLLPPGLTTNKNDGTISMAEWDKANALPPLSAHAATFRTEASTQAQDAEDVLLPLGVGR